MEEVRHMSDPDTVPEDLRQQAARRLKQRRDFWAHLVIYIMVNTFLVVLWAFTGSGFFWPVIVMFAWGIGLAMNAYEAFLRPPITEADIDREVRRLQQRREA
jgi:hypothetical protein